MVLDRITERHKNMNIAIDIEGTVADVHEAFLQWFNTKYDTNFTIKDIDNWNIAKTKLGITTSEFIESLRKLWKQQCTMTLTDSNIPKIIDRLIDSGHRIYFVTAHYEVAPQIIDWINKNRLKHSGFMAVKNTEVKKILSFDLFIDDCPLLVESLGHRLFLYNRPYNTNTKAINRFTDFSELTNRINMWPRRGENESL